MTLAEELQAVARTGLNYTDNPYDRENYERILAAAADIYADVAALSSEEVRRRFGDEIGVLTPKIGADACIFDDEGRILLVERSDDETWGLVSGWVDANEHPADTAVREAAEEVGLEIEVDRLVDLILRPASAESGPHATLCTVFLAHAVSGDIIPNHEVLSARYWHLDDVPVWHKNHEELARAAANAR